MPKLFSGQYLICLLTILLIAIPTTKHWNRKEVAFFKRRLVGKKLAADWTFHPKVDAVASATMTAAIIFDDLSQGKELLEELKALNLLERSRK